MVPRHNSHKLSSASRHAFSIAVPSVWKSLTDYLCDPSVKKYRLNTISHSASSALEILYHTLTIYLRPIGTKCLTHALNQTTLRLYLAVLTIMTRNSRRSWKNSRYVDSTVWHSFSFPFYWSV